jgi:hypothetical protein
MSFLKNLFGLGGSEPKVRGLSHPRDIRAGDIIKFRYLDLPDVSGQAFEVTQINTYLYGDLCYPELILKDRSGNIIYMMVEEEDGEEYLALSKKIDKAKINEVIPPNDMTAIQASGNGTAVRVGAKPEGFQAWLVEDYREVDDRVEGSFIKGDARYLSDQDVNRREHFTSHILEDSEGDFALEIEIYETGEVELSATVYKEISDIEEMWPGGQSERT